MNVVHNTVLKMNGLQIFYLIEIEKVMSLYDKIAKLKIDLNYQLEPQILNEA